MVGAEAQVLDLVASSTVLPDAWPNPMLRDGSGQPLLPPDVWFEDVALAVMVHAHAHLSQGEQWDTTVERDAELIANGVIVIGVTPRRVRTEPEVVLKRIETAYALASGRARPRVVATPRHLAARHRSA